MLIAGAVYKSLGPVKLSVRQKEMEDSITRGELTYIFGDYLYIPEGRTVLVLESKKTTLKKLSKILYKDKIYNYFYTNKDPELDWEFVC